MNFSKKKLASHAEHLFRTMTSLESFPCIGAIAAHKKQSVEVKTYLTADSNSAQSLIRDIEAFEEMRGKEFDEIHSSFVAIFPNWKPETEDEFQNSMWSFLQLIHNEDHRLGNSWTQEASADVSDPYFGFSINKRAYFIVGIHPNSSRWARRFLWPTLVFNSHYQFSRLREMNVFEQMKMSIRQRDHLLQGSANPEMVGTKEVSEARQYSGRKNEDNWKCPLKIISE